MAQKTYLEDVFKTSGIPTHTFVKPDEYSSLVVALRAKGRGVVVEGPSGIGKTTCVQKALEELGLNKDVYKLSARKIGDVDLIESVPEMTNIGTVIVDDFHVLSDTIKAKYANFLKVLADEERENDKVILVGINKAANSLVHIVPDVNNRIATIKLGRTSDEKILQLIGQGERALNIALPAQVRDAIIKYSKGSFHITQYLCHEICVMTDILEQQKAVADITVNFDSVKQKVLRDLERSFSIKAKKFSTGTRLRREGRAPYLMLLYWLSLSDDWTINIRDMLREHPGHKISVTQIVEKGYLKRLIEENDDIKDCIHYDQNSDILTVEDPKFMFYIRNMPWSRFARQIGFVNITFNGIKAYDFALSFAGENRDLAKRLYQLLVEREIAVFYDEGEQSNILAEDVKEYLESIYSSEARFVVVLLSSYYPKKVWTNIESESFKGRFDDNAVIPIWYSDCPMSAFDESRKYGGVDFNVQANIEDEATRICDLLAKKLEVASA